MTDYFKRNWGCNGPVSFLKELFKRNWDLLLPLAAAIGSMSYLLYMLIVHHY